MIAGGKTMGFEKMKKIKRFAALLLIFVMTAGLPLLNTDRVKAADGMINVTINASFRQADARKMLPLINQFRSGKDAWYYDEESGEKVECDSLPELEYDYTLEKVAMKRALEIALCYDEKRHSGQMWKTAYSECDYTGDNCAENMTYGQDNVSAAIVALREDKGGVYGQEHRRKMLSADYTGVGIAHLYYNKTHYWVQEFGDLTNTYNDTAETDTAGADYTVVVNPSRIEEISASEKYITMEIGTEKDLKDMQIFLEMDENVNSAKTYLCPIVSEFDLDLGETDILSLKDKKLKAEKKGDAELTVFTLGKEFTIPVSVIDRIEYTVEYYPTGGRCDVDEVKTVNKMISSLPAAVREGYEFEGWFTGREDTAEKVTGQKVYAEDTILYAHWKEITEIPAMAKPSLSVKKAKKITVSRGEIENVSGYEFCYSTTKKFKAKKTKYIDMGKDLSVTIDNLKSGKKYYFRIRAYIEKEDSTLYGKWSGKASVKTK